MVCLILSTLTSPAHAWVNTSRQVIGTTVAAVGANFVGVINANVSSPAGAARLAGLSAAEQQALANSYAQQNGGNAYALYAILQVYSPEQARRFLPAADRADLAWRTGALVIQNAERMAPAGTPAPTLDMTLQDIYLEYRTATVGALSPASAIYMTTTYAAVNLAAAFSAGYTLGTGISWLIQTYAPSLDNAIGATLFNIINSLETVTTVYGQGLYEQRLLPVLDVSLSNLYTVDYSGADYGDWGTSDAISAPLCLNWC